MFKKVTIIGAGLIGSSVGRGLAAQGVAVHYVDVDRGQLSDVDGAGLVVLATPVLVMPEVLRQILPFLAPTTILMDVASTKSFIIEQAQIILGQARCQYFVGSHPIAGKETSGFAAGEAGLFTGKPVIVTPMPNTNPSALAQVKQLWESLGAHLYEMSPENHDLAFGKYSHLSNILSFLLQQQEAYAPTLPAELLPPSFKEMTRLAQSSPEMWRDICLSNREAIVKNLEAFIRDTTAFRTLLAIGDPKALLQFFQKN